jgi:hypothetical protein
VNLPEILRLADLLTGKSTSLPVIVALLSTMSGPSFMT